jgi:glycosyltransferase involved in cell wall biosynthesis
MNTLQLIVPCFNEEESLPVFYETVSPILDGIRDCDCSFIFVDDGSRDGTLGILHRMAESDGRVKYVSFSRNFGKESAMLAGLRLSSADYVGIIDADLQHSPELIGEMLAAVREEGYDIAAARRIDRKGEDKLKSAFSRSFYKLINRISDTEIEDKIEKVSHWLYTEDPIRGLFLYGTVGSGKTTLMKAVCSLIRASGSGSDLAVLTTATALFDEYCQYQNDRANHYEEMRRARYLFLDDLGIEPSRCLIYGVERYPIQDIIYARYDRQLVTVITSNLDRSGLRDRYGERMYDRMAEMMLPLCFMATSYRRQTKK